jgi:hypothetical protein
MNLENIKALATSKIARQTLITRKYSPQVLFVAGTVGVIGATVLACRATLKVPFVLDDHDKNMADIGEAALAVDSLESDETKREVIKLKLRTALEVTKLYLPAVGLGAVSIAALTGSHVVLTKRNGAAMAAYAGIDRAYREYRKRVTDAYGEDVDRKFSGGAEDISIEEKTAEGRTKTKNVLGVKKDGKFGGSPYAVVFDEQSRFFSKEPGMNAQIIAMKQNWANDKLRANGHLFLNEVYDMLGLPRTKEGTIVGWVYDPRNEAHAGDNYVTFNIFEGEPELVEGFLDGAYRYVVIDPNVDGMIWDKI